MWLRILGNTKKQIIRSGWVGWASVSVMTLAFLVGLIFGGLAYMSNLYIQFIEHKSNILVFFNEGMDEKIVNELWANWEDIDEIKLIDYTSEEEAYKLYADYTERVQPEIYAVLKTKEEKKLPSSLDIQIWSLEDLNTVKDLIQVDIEEKLSELEVNTTTTNTTNNIEDYSPIIDPSDTTNDDFYRYDEDFYLYDDSLTDPFRVQDNTNYPQYSDDDYFQDVVSLYGSTLDEGNINREDNEDLLSSDDADDTSGLITYRYSGDNPYEPPIVLKVDDESLDQLREVLFILRIAGISVITLLFIVIVFFTFMTVEFRLFNQMEEIGVMQLVGGSLFFIRSPYVLEGGFYGFIGALISSIILGSLIVIIFVVNSNSALTVFLYENFGNLPWPEVSYFGWFGIVGAICAAGFVLGASSSYLAIRRYIR